MYVSENDYVPSSLPLKIPNSFLLFTIVFYYHFVFASYFAFHLLDLQVMNLIGDVKGKVAVMVDDMIDTAGNEPDLVHC